MAELPEEIKDSILEAMKYEVTHPEEEGILKGWLELLWLAEKGKK